jgi:hypothetical protein
MKVGESQSPRQSKPEPVIVIEEAAEIEKALRANGIPFEATFAAALDDARRARRDLGRYIRAELKRADKQRAKKLREILAAERTYLWHCGGFERSGARYLHCSFAPSRAGDEALRAPRFPEGREGQASTNRCTFSLQSGQIVTLGAHDG